MTPAMLSCWLILFAFALKNFVTISVLYSPQSVVVSALQFELWSGGQPEDPYTGRKPRRDRRGGDELPDPPIRGPER